MTTLTSPPARHAFGGDGGPLFFAALGGLLGGKLGCRLVSNPIPNTHPNPSPNPNPNANPNPNPSPNPNPNPAGLYQQSGGQLWLPLATHALWNLVVVLERAALLAQSA